MTLNYNQYIIRIDFTSSVSFETYPLFIIRSIIGKELKSLCCIAHQNQCESCMYNQTCAYAWIFETFLNKQNFSLPGRVRGVHPWSLKLNDCDENHITFTLTLFEKANEYLPYIYAALKRGEEKGFGKNRTSYSVQKVICKDFNLLSEDGNHITLPLLETFNISEDCNTLIDVKYKINLVSPLRFNKDGKICKQLSEKQFFQCINRRIRTLCSLYSDDYTETPYGFSNIQISDVHLHYENLTRWSSRQKVVQNLGGIKGSFSLCGKISLFEESLLKAAELFGAGKLTNFGLGQISVEYL